MRLRKSSGKPRRRNPWILLRRIEGSSMLPAFPSGKVIVATKLVRALRPGDVVIFLHGGLEKMKVIRRVEGTKLFVTGLNAERSTDSRQFGWIDQSLVIARVLTRSGYGEA